MINAIYVMKIIYSVQSVAIILRLHFHKKTMYYVSALRQKVVSSMQLNITQHVAAGRPFQCQLLTFVYFPGYLLYSNWRAQICFA